MKDRNPRRRFPLVVAFCAALLVLAFVTSTTMAQNPGENGVTNRAVAQRMAMMNSATTALETLVNMMGGRIRFDRVQARAARRVLINTARAMPSAFKKPQTDPLSGARPDIWTNWDDFETRADAAKRVARRLNTDRLETLRTTLPDVLNSCLSCHQTYRKP
jgi:cytochrome c556